MKDNYCFTASGHIMTKKEEFIMIVKDCMTRLDRIPCNEDRADKLVNKLYCLCETTIDDLEDLKDSLILSKS